MAATRGKGFAADDGQDGRSSKVACECANPIVDEQRGIEW
jgi:hypothetical protein